MAGVKGQRSGGRNAKSRQEHERKGTFRKDRHQQRSPDAPEGTPRPPRELDGEARAEWDRMIVRLSGLKTLSPVDDAILYQYCRMFAETEQLVEEKAEAQSAVDRLDESFADVEKSDLMAFFIEVGKMRKLAASYDAKIRSNRMALRMLLTEFGLTPASRGRVKLPEISEEVDAFTSFQQERPGLVRVK